MLKYFTMLILIHLMSGCVESNSLLKDKANNGYKYPQDSSSDAELKSRETEKNLLTTDHIACFKCETGTYPISVKQLVKFSPSNEICKAIFTNKRFQSNQPQFNLFRITTTEISNGVAFVMSKKGLKLENISRAEEDFFILTIYKNRLSCNQ